VLSGVLSRPPPPPFPRKNSPCHCFFQQSFSSFAVPPPRGAPCLGLERLLLKPAASFCFLQALIDSSWLSFFFFSMVLSFLSFEPPACCPPLACPSPRPFHRVGTACQGSPALAVPLSLSRCLHSSRSPPAYASFLSRSLALFSVFSYCAFGEGGL